MSANTLRSPGTGQTAGLAVRGRATVEAGDHVGAHPAASAGRRGRRRSRKAGRRHCRSRLGRAQHGELHPSGGVGHEQHCNTSLRCLHGRVQRRRTSGRPAPQGHAGATDRPTDPAADLRRRQLRHLHPRSRRAVAVRGRAVLPAVLRPGGRATGRQEEAVRPARGAARASGVYLDGGFGVGKTHLLASSYYRLPDTARHSRRSAS